MTKPTQIYLLECMGYHKIGVSCNAYRRCKSISGSMPERGRVVRVWECPGHAYQVEQMLHRCFWQYRTNGEWFKFPAKRLREFTNKNQDAVTEAMKGIIT